MPSFPNGGRSLGSERSCWLPKDAQPAGGGNETGPQVSLALQLTGRLLGRPPSREAPGRTYTSPRKRTLTREHGQVTGSPHWLCRTPPPPPRRFTLPQSDKSQPLRRFPGGRAGRVLVKSKLRTCFSELKFSKEWLAPGSPWPHLPTVHCSWYSRGATAGSQGQSSSAGHVLGRGPPGMAPGVRTSNVQLRDGPRGPRAQVGPPGTVHTPARTCSAPRSAMCT